MSIVGSVAFSGLVMGVGLLLGLISIISCLRLVIYFYGEKKGKEKKVIMLTLPYAIFAFRNFALCVVAYLIMGGLISYENPRAIWRGRHVQP